MKILFLLSFFIFINAHAFSYKEPNLTEVSKKVTASYNKNSGSAKNAKVDKKFLSELNAKASKSNSFWKAEVVGDIVYFKKGRGMFKLQLVEVKTSSHFVMKMNGKTFEFNVENGYQKNYELIKTAMQTKSATLWDIVIPRANAYEIEAPDEMEEQLQDALSWTTWALSYFRDERDLQHERICNLNKAETSSYNGSNRVETLHEEIKFLVRIQDTFVKPYITKSRTYGSMDAPELAQELQSCIMGLADRRKKKMEEYGKSYSCYTSQSSSDSHVYLSSTILTSSLINETDRYEDRVGDLDHELERCGIRYSYSSTEIEECKSKAQRRFDSQNTNCPQSAESLATIRKANSDNASAGSR